MIIIIIIIINININNNNNNAPKYMLKDLFVPKICHTEPQKWKSLNIKVFGNILQDVLRSLFSHFFGEKKGYLF